VWPRKRAVSKHFASPPRLTSVSALPCETGTPLRQQNAAHAYSGSADERDEDADDGDTSPVNAAEAASATRHGRKTADVDGVSRDIYASLARLIKDRRVRRRDKMSPSTQLSAARCSQIAARTGCVAQW